jgi:hypothetical protein
MADLPYGVTYQFSGPYPLLPIPQQLINDIAALAPTPGMWLRGQVKWSRIEYTPTSTPTYDWSIVDDLIDKCVLKGINVCFPIQSAPAWRLNIDINGNYCASTLTSNLNTTTTYTSLPIAALPSNGVILAGPMLVDPGNASTETVTVTGGPYAAGATSLSISAWKPAFAHANGANVVSEAGNTASAADTLAFAQQLAARYNGTTINALTGQAQTARTLQSIQIGNEEFDTNGTNAQRDTQSQILVPVVQLVAPAIRALAPSCAIGICAVRKLGGATGPSLSHITNWITNLYTFQPAGSSQVGIGYVTYLDFHYYRDGVFVNGTQSADPTVDVPSGTGANVPSAARELATILSISQSYAAAGGFAAPEARVQEFGWDCFDDGTGPQTTLSSAISAGVAITALPVATTLTSVIPDATQLTVDYMGTHQETVYTYGATTKGTSSIAITTNPLGSGAVQAAWTPGFNHASTAIVYTAAINYVTQAQQAQYITGKGEMLDMLRLGGATHGFVWTMNPQTNVQTWIVPPKSTSTKSLTQNIISSKGGGSTYTYLPAYAALQQYIAQYTNWVTPTIPLTVYLSKAASAVLATANQLYTTAGTPATSTEDTGVSTATRFGELHSSGSLGTWAALSSIGAPTGHGFFLDGTLLDNQVLGAGLWSATIKLAAFQGGAQAGMLSGDIYIRAFKYRSGTYTNIVTMVLMGQTISVPADFVLPATNAGQMAFLPGDKLYIDQWVNITSNTNGATNQIIRTQKMSTDTTGLTGSSEAGIVTPGFIAPGSGGSGGSGSLASVLLPPFRRRDGLLPPLSRRDGQVPNITRRG